MAVPLSSAAELMVHVGVTEDPGRDTGPGSFEGGFSSDNGGEDFGFLNSVPVGADDEIQVRNCVETKTVFVGVGYAHGLMWRKSPSLVNSKKNKEMTRLCE